MSMLLYKQLKARGWDGATLQYTFGPVHEKIRLRPQRKTTNQNYSRTESKSPFIWNIIHMIYHVRELALIVA